MSSSPSLPDLHPTYGALLIGVYFATFFQGVLTVQTYIYFESFPEDPWGMKSLVTIVWLLDVAHLVLICQTAYHYLVSNWGNQQALLSTTPTLDIHLVLLTLSIMACQSFYVNRVWKFSKNVLLTGLLGTASLASGILYFTLTVQLLQNRSIETVLKRRFLSETIAVFSVGAAVDLAIAILMVWYLGRERTNFDRVRSLVTRLIQVSVATGLVTSFIALGSLIALIASADSLIFLAIHVSLGRTYTNALLATLNSRKGLRAHLAHPAGLKWTTSSGGRSTSAPHFPASPHVYQEFPLKTVGEDNNSTTVQEVFDSQKRFDSTV